MTERSMRSAIALSHLSTSYTTAAFDRLTATQTASFSYDGNGNLVSKSEGKDLWRYVWDGENRLSSASTRKYSVRYRYDALGRRVQRYAPGNRDASTKFTYDGMDVLMDDDNGTLTKYQNGPGIDNKLSVKQGTTTNYFVQDHLGSTDALTDASGAVVSSALYDSFGNPTNNLATRYQFTGREYDSFTGLMHYRARSYDPKLGRFISEDPIGFSGGINQYAYVSNGPIDKTDPLGLYERDVHFYLTYYLALKSGCFNRQASFEIAAGDQGTDDNPATAPGFNRPFQNARYHALTQGASQGVGSTAMAPYVPTRGLRYFGTSLHYLQDTFSHSGYPHPVIGHVLGTHSVDKTASDVEKAMQMAWTTYRAIDNYAQLTCGCRAKGWDTEMESTITSFSEVPTAHPYAADIDGATGLPGFPPISFNLADPDALQRKASILGF